MLWQPTRGILQPNQHWRRPQDAGGGGGGGGWTLVADAEAPASAWNNAATTSAIDTSGANLLIAAGSQYGGYAPGSVTDSKGNTWMALTTQGSGNPSLSFFYCASPIVGSGHTFSYYNGLSNGLAGVIAVQAWSGAGASPFDVENGATGSGTSPAQTGSVTPSQNNSLIVAGYSDATNTGYSIDSGFTVTANLDPTPPPTEGLLLAYLVQATATAINPAVSSTSAQAYPSALKIAVFKP